jgi:hypothetical protein
MFACCSSAALCTECRHSRRMQLVGVARSRGERWAASVALRCNRERPWPRTPKAHAIALTKVADIAEDVELRVDFAHELEAYAARWWGRQLQAWNEYESQMHARLQHVR